MRGLSTPSNANPQNKRNSLAQFYNAYKDVDTRVLPSEEPSNATTTVLSVMDLFDQWTPYTYPESRWDELEMSKYADLCSSRKLYSCANPLLRWFHGQTDFLAIIAYFVLFPLKLIVVVVLRKDIQELFGEIVYAGNQHLYRQYRHWAAIDPPERFNNDLSSSLQFSMETITSTTALMEPQKVLKE
ncbi:hypothetical protein Tcan_14896 [Toxocara canis]|uniref:Uncharacterized protein n=1 Tax=Toxocara canis TaxID=6265 RepID=A0A0B2V626_TOXCA|nr:hypothetical protein Tcan_14896 [Toxocara canis]